MLPASLKGLIRGACGPMAARGQHRAVASSSAAANLQEGFGHTPEDQHQAGTPDSNQYQHQSTEHGFPSADSPEFGKYNNFYLTGNVCQHPVLRLDRSSRPFTTLLIARNQKGRDRNGNMTERPPEFFQFMAAGQIAQSIMSQVRKGQRVTIEANVRSKPALSAAGAADNMASERAYTFWIRNLTLIHRPIREHSLDQGFAPQQQQGSWNQTQEQQQQQQQPQQADPWPQPGP